MLSFALLLLAAPPPRHNFTVDDMLAMRRLSSPAASPDGRTVAFVVRDTDLEANRGRTDLWSVGADGQGLRRLTTHPESDSEPRWSADGQWIYFLSTRGGSSQVWRISPAGGEAEVVTSLALDVGGFALFPDGRLLVALEVYPALGKIEETKARDDADAKSKVKARAYDRLLYRHWDQWEDDKRSHLFVLGADGNLTDLMAGMDADAPGPPFGGMEEVAISPDGQWVVFATKDEGAQAAWSTNHDLWIVPASGKAKPARLTASNKAWDNNPVFSPDGKTLAYLAMARPMYESDATRVVLMDLASRKTRVIGEKWDRSPTSILWSKDGKTIFTTADHLGNHGLFALDVASGQVRGLVEKASNTSPVLAQDRLVFLQDSLRSPAELFSVRPDGTGLTAVTQLNKERLEQIAWAEQEQFTFKGAKGDTVYGFVLKPAGLKPGVKVPVAMLVHGGPQGSFGDHFHYRWNPQAYAGRGFGTVFIDFHGSTGYGQAFTDAIRGDWGGAPYEDLMLGLDFALKKYPWLDGSRAAALGASYGGFMINWINGQTDRFKALVCHDGNLDERFAYFDTEELWFPEWEHGGTPWDAPAGFSKHNPIEHVKKWKTPTLVVHGGNDFRVVDTQGMATFTALQRQGIPSRFLHFPDENHWVLKPQNSKRWHDEVLGWIERYTKPKAAEAPKK